MMDLSIQESSGFVLFGRSYDDALIGTDNFSMPVPVVVIFHELEIPETIPSFWEGKELSIVSTRALINDDYQCDICSEKLGTQVKSDESALFGDKIESKFVLISHVETEETCVLHGDCFQQFVKHSIKLIQDNPESVAVSNL